VDFVEYLAAARRAGLSEGARMLYRVLRALAVEESGALVVREFQTELAARIGAHRHTVQGYINELRDAGWVDVVYSSPNRWRVDHYTLWGPR
jgi:hypothetical protein